MSLLLYFDDSPREERERRAFGFFLIRTKEENMALDVLIVVPDILDYVLGTHEWVRWRQEEEEEEEEEGFGS